MLRRCCSEIKRYFGLWEEVPSGYDDLVARFHELLQRVKRERDRERERGRERERERETDRQTQRQRQRKRQR